MEEWVQLHAKVPRQLKRRLYVELAWREETFAWWLQTQMEVWLAEVEDQHNVRQEREPSHAAAE